MPGDATAPGDVERGTAPADEAAPGTTVTGVSDSEGTSCYRHPDRHSGVICQRCDRPICSECMHQASVGFHCPECAKAGKQRVIRGPVAFDPIVTKALIAINVAASVGAWVWGGSFAGLSGKAVEKYSLFGPFVDDGEFYRIFTASVLHDGFLHLGFNMYALWILGGQLERLFKPPRYVALYLISLLSGAFGVLLLDPTAPTVGASGAVFGLFGAIAVVQRSSGASIWSSGLGPILGINLLLTFAVPQISIGGHLGGLIGGAMVGAIYVAALRQRQSDGVAVTAASVLGLVFFLGSLWAAAQWANPIF